MADSSRNDPDAQAAAADKTFLVVGAGGLIGNALMSGLACGGAAVVGTRRRADSSAGFFLDLQAGVAASLADPLWRFIVAERPTVIFAAGITGLAECEADPQGTRRVNVENTVAFLVACLEAGCAVLYLSSSAVFSGGTRLPTESSDPDPMSEYGRQKAEVEAMLLRHERASADAVLMIARLTKVLPDSRGLVGGWLERLGSRSAISAYSDVMLSPLSLAFVSAALAGLARRPVGGVFHLSGERDVSYAELAAGLASGLGADRGLVVAAQRGIDGGRPMHCGLGAEATRRQLGIAPQPLEAVVRDLLEAT